MTGPSDAGNRTAAPEGRTPDRARTAKILADLSQRSVLVVGDLILDEYLHGRVDRISPEAPVPVLLVEKADERPGGAANVAANLAALGAVPVLVGCVGRDRAATRLRDRLALAGIGVGGVVGLEDRCTTTKSRLVSRSQQLARFDRETEAPVSPEVETVILDLAVAAMGRVQTVVLEDYDKGVLTLTVIRGIIEEAANRSIPVVVDPKHRNFFSYEGATVFKPNVREARTALGESAPGLDAGWLRRLRTRVGSRNLLLTMGAEGMVLVGEDEVPTRLVATARSVFDVSGAGDTVTAVLAATLAAGGTVLEGAHLANHAAGVCVGRMGVTAVSGDDILSVLE
ncbi:MAG: PfkB family carbohydrate kinase [Gemmatimonadota bacterium]